MATAATPDTQESPEITQAFVADRERFWGSFTSFVTGGAIVVAVLLVLMAVFLV